MLKHTSYTWLLAHLLHPLCRWLISLTQWKHYLFQYFIAGFQDLLLITIVGLIFSAPALFVATALLHLLAGTKMPVVVLFLSWTFSICGLIAATVQLFLSSPGNMWQPDNFVIGIPAILAVWFALIIRYKQFARFIHSIQINHHEEAGLV